MSHATAPTQPRRLIGLVNQQSLNARNSTGHRRLRKTSLVSFLLPPFASRDREAAVLLRSVDVLAGLRVHPHPLARATNSGTLIVTPFSSFAGFVDAVFVAVFITGAVSTISSIKEFGSWMPIGRPL